MSISQVLLMTTFSLLASLALSSPLVVVTKLEVRKNLFSDTETSFCYEVNTPFMREYLNILAVWFSLFGNPSPSPSPSPKSQPKIQKGDFGLWATSKISWATTPLPQTFKHEGMKEAYIKKKLKE